MQWGRAGWTATLPDSHSRPQEMLAIMKSIYDMMGHHTCPVLREDAPLEHVEKFFQVGPSGSKRNSGKSPAHTHPYTPPPQKRFSYGFLLAGYGMQCTLNPYSPNHITSSRQAARVGGQLTSWILRPSKSCFNSFRDGVKGVGEGAAASIAWALVADSALV